MKLQYLLLLCGLAPLCAGAALPALPDGKAVKKAQQQSAVIHSRPRIVGNSIVCGNKSLSFDVDGKIKISADGVAVGDFYCYYSVQKKDGKKTSDSNKEACN